MRTTWRSLTLLVLEPGANISAAGRCCMLLALLTCIQPAVGTAALVSGLLMSLRAQACSS